MNLDLGLRLHRLKSKDREQCFRLWGVKLSRKS